MTDEEWERLLRPLENTLDSNKLSNNEISLPIPRDFPSESAKVAFPKSMPEHDRNVCWQCNEQMSDFKLLLAHVLEEHAHWREGTVNILYDLKNHGTQRVR